MLHDRIRTHQQAADLEEMIARMPAYPVYRERPNLYCIYIDGEAQRFPSEKDAKLGQLVAKMRWLRSQPLSQTVGNSSMA